MSLSADQATKERSGDSAAQTSNGVGSSGVPVKIRNLVKRYGHVVAVDNVSFDVEPCSTVSLLGPSGCGKTTTLRCIAGLEVPSGGEITIGDKLVYDGARDILMEPEKRNIGMVFQSYAIWPHMTVGGNVGFPLKIAKRPRAEIRERVARILSLVGLGELEKRSASALSGGQQQRVALARALVYEPRVVLFDEPLSNLDANLRERMRSELTLLQEELKFTAIFVTHDQQEALALSDNVVLMRSGLIEQQGTPEEVFKDPQTLFAAQFLGYSNQFSGRIAEVEDHAIMVEVESGKLVPAVWRSAGTPRVGDDAVVAIRGDRVSLLPPGSPTSGVQLTGRVEVAAFLGSHINYVVKGGGLTFNVEGTVDNAFSRGDEVAIELTRDHCHAYDAGSVERKTGSIPSVPAV